MRWLAVEICQHLSYANGDQEIGNSQTQYQQSSQQSLKAQKHRTGLREMYVTSHLIYCGTASKINICESHQEAHIKVLQKL